MREFSDLACVRNLHSIAASHLFHRPALIAIQHAQFPAYAASGQVGDDAVAHAGG